jgi:ribonuclease P protein component
MDRAEDFKRVFRRGARSSDAFFTLLASPNGLEWPRLGLAVSRRHAGSAVTRNRVKRIARESFRSRQHEIGGLDVIVMSRAPAATADNATLFTSLEGHWQRLLERCASS